MKMHTSKVHWMRADALFLSYSLTLCRHFAGTASSVPNRKFTTKRTEALHCQQYGALYLTGKKDIVAQTKHFLFFFQRSWSLSATDNIWARNYDITSKFQIRHTIQQRLENEENSTERIPFGIRLFDSFDVAAAFVIVFTYSRLVGFFSRFLHAAVLSLFAQHYSRVIRGDQISINCLLDFGNIAVADCVWLLLLLLTSFLFAAVVVGGGGGGSCFSSLLSN